jgi:hypothetical protein
VRFERKRPRVVPAEGMGTTLTISDDDRGLSLDDIRPAELERLRSRLVSALASWEPVPSAPVVEVSAEDDDREMTRGLVVAMLLGDLELAKVWLSRGADPDGHPEAGGRGAPLFIARLRGDVLSESLLRARGATIMEVDSSGLRVLEILAATSGLSELADMLAQRRQ